MKISTTSTARVLLTCLNPTLGTTFFEYSSLATYPGLLSEPLALNAEAATLHVIVLPSVLASISDTSSFFAVTAVH